MLDRACYSCVLHVFKLVWDTQTKSWVPLHKVTVSEAEFWGRYIYQLAHSGPYKEHLNGRI